MLGQGARFEAPGCSSGGGASSAPRTGKSGQSEGWIRKIVTLKNIQLITIYNGQILKRLFLIFKELEKKNLKIV